MSWLNVSANHLAIFDLAMVPAGLKWLDLHGNRLRAIENYFGVESNLQIAHLDASFNKIEELGPQSVPDVVEVLLLNDNRISTLVPYTFYKKTKLRKADLSVNRLETIDASALKLASLERASADGQDARPKFFFGGNPIRCDCNMSWFREVNDEPIGVSGPRFPLVADLESIYCQLLHSRERSFVPLVDAGADDFLCEYEKHCFPVCHCCDFDACDCEMTCPKNCTCYHDGMWAKNIADCSSSDFHSLPDQLPMDATEIFLDGNNIGRLQSHTFIGRKNLR